MELKWNDNELLWKARNYMTFERKSVHPIAETTWVKPLEANIYSSVCVCEREKGMLKLKTVHS